MVLSAANIQAMARAGIRSFRQQARMLLPEVQDDRARFEQGEVAFLVRRDLPEGMQRQMRGLLHLGEGHEAHVVRLVDFFERPAHPHVARQSAAAVG
jgi:hypothetical protein